MTSQPGPAVYLYASLKKMEARTLWGSLGRKSDSLLLVLRAAEVQQGQYGHAIRRRHLSTRSYSKMRGPSLKHLQLLSPLWVQGRTAEMGARSKGFCYVFFTDNRPIICIIHSNPPSSFFKYSHFPTPCFRGLQDNMIGNPFISCLNQNTVRKNIQAVNFSVNLPKIRLQQYLRSCPEGGNMSRY